jgi:hypothetical protein
VLPPLVGKIKDGLITFAPVVSSAAGYDFVGSIIIASWVLENHWQRRKGGSACLSFDWRYRIHRQKEGVGIKAGSAHGDG